LNGGVLLGNLWKNMGNLWEIYVLWGPILEFPWEFHGISGKHGEIWEHISIVG
jgi:hypothetical protein